jgi:hypothetical protein
MMIDTNGASDRVVGAVGSDTAEDNGGVLVNMAHTAEAVPTAESGTAMVLRATLLYDLVPLDPPLSGAIHNLRKWRHHRDTQYVAFVLNQSERIARQLRGFCSFTQKSLLPWHTSCQPLSHNVSNP